MLSKRVDLTAWITPFIRSGLAITAAARTRTGSIAKSRLVSAVLSYQIRFAYRLSKLPGIALSLALSIFHGHRFDLFLILLHLAIFNTDSDHSVYSGFDSFCEETIDLS